MSDQNLEQRLTALETDVGHLKAAIIDVFDNLDAAKTALATFQTALQATLGPLILQIQGESGLANRMTALEATQYAQATQLADLQSFDTQQKRGPSTLDLANQLADLSLQLNRLQNADRYALTREKLGRLMVAHNLVSADELQASTEQPA